VRFGIVGCGGRGTAAAVNLMTADPNTELVAMADIFEDKLEGSLRQLRDPAYIERNAGKAAPLLNQTVNELVKSISSRVKVDPNTTSSASMPTRRSSLRRRPGAARHASGVPARAFRGSDQRGQTLLGD
jgi:hypothetical protein